MLVNHELATNELNVFEARNILEPELITTAEMQNVALLNSVCRTYFFASDATDEFQIEREGGERQGIFKVWAMPIIPLLEVHTPDAHEALRTWSERLANKPLSLFESLERWRTFSSIADRRLQTIFDRMPLPESSDEAIPELFARLEIAFAFAAPFYNIEALVVDNRSDKSDNPIDFDSDGSAAGKLDAVAMLLPAALQDKVVARELQWGSLSWAAIENDITAMKQDFLSGSESIAAQQFKLLNVVAALAGMSPGEVLFAVNALEFIPTQVGGKRNDMPQSIAIDTLDKLLTSDGGLITTNTVAKNMNALIRFLNWTPAIKSEDNFQGKHWAYDAVCATSSRLFNLVQENASLVFNPDSVKEFEEHLVPQLGNLDASSARGRFMLQLWHEGSLNGSLNTEISQLITIRSQEVLSALNDMQREEAVLDSNAGAPTFLVGGKVTGLCRAENLLGRENVLFGRVVTTEAVNTWLEQIEGVSELIDSLSMLYSMDEKLIIAQDIAQKIRGADVPCFLTDKLVAPFVDFDMHRVILRSSAFDEDSDIIGPAPGIYESVAGVDSFDSQSVADGFKTVVASFFSDKAVCFRDLKGLQHNPVIAVLAQRLISGPGGSIFVNNGKVRLNLAAAPSHINDTKEGQNVEDLLFHVDDDPNKLVSKFFLPSQLCKIAWMAERIESAFGPSDIEFVEDPVFGIKLLQMRSLERPRPNTQHQEVGELVTVFVNNLNELPKLTDKQPVNLHISDTIDTETFQGALFRLIVANKDNVRGVTLKRPIPATCHFANILASLNIILTFESED